MRAIVQRRGQHSFRRKLLKSYDGTCAISNTKCEEALEAAHICPYGGAKTNHMQNGLILRADIHTLFDLGFIVIDDEYKVVIHDELKKTVYNEYSGLKIKLPNDVECHPSKEALGLHREQSKISAFNGGETDRENGRICD